MDGQMLNPFANRKLLKRGERAQARIVEMTTPEHGAEPSNVEMALEVTFRGVPYEVRDRWMVSGTEPIGPGSEIWVAVDPEKPERVAIDWKRTRADYKERTDPRRELLGAGVPVPVTKVRDVLERANGTPAKAEEPAEPEKAPAQEADPDPVPAEEVAAVAKPPKPRRKAPADPFEGMSLHERELLGHVGTAVATPPPKVSPPVALPPARRVPREPARPRLVPSATAPVQPAKPAPAAKADAEDLTSKLERLAALRASGALTEGEFAAAKAHVLSSG